MPFRHFGLDEKILHALQDAGYTVPTPIQEAAIPKALLGHDLVAIARTGTGKTAAFVLPLLQRLLQRRQEGSLHGTHALILAPTRELAIQITENIRAYGKHLSVHVAPIYGGVAEGIQIKALRRGVPVIVATPGRLIDLLGRVPVDFSGLEILVLDEADRMLHMGFLPDITTILRDLPVRRQTLMFSATFSREIESLAHRFQHRPERIQIGSADQPAESVAQSVYEIAPHLKGNLLLALLAREELSMVLVFVRMKDGADRLAELLRNSGISVTRLHSSRSQEQREKALRDFKEGKVRVLVATDIVSRGIDIEGVSHVVNFDFPVNPEDYIHRIGRTGRAEAQGAAISFVSRGDLNLLGHLELTIGERIPRKRLAGFDYRATTPALKPGENPAKRDWRKRTRESESRTAKKAAPKASGKKSIPKPPPAKTPPRKNGPA